MTARNLRNYSVTLQDEAVHSGATHKLGLTGIASPVIVQALCEKQAKQIARAVWTGWVPIAAVETTETTCGRPIPGPEVLDSLTHLHVKVDSLAFGRGSWEGVIEVDHLLVPHMPAFPADDVINEYLFRFFNVVYEADFNRLRDRLGYRLPSLSVGDVITWGGKSYRVDDVGFSEYGGVNDGAKAVM